VIAFLSAGVGLGLYAGFSPGPLLALIIAQTIRHGPKEGVKVAFAPIITDFPIILISTFLLVYLSNYKWILYRFHFGWSIFGLFGIYEY